MHKDDAERAAVGEATTRPAASQSDFAIVQAAHIAHQARITRQARVDPAARPSSWTGGSYATTGRYWHAATLSTVFGQW